MQPSRWKCPGGRDRRWIWLVKHAAVALQLGDIGKRRKQSGKAAKVSVEGRGMAVG